MNDLKKITSWLSYLFYKAGNQSYDFELQVLEKEGIKTKRKKYSEICFDIENKKNKWFLSKANQRQILPFEVVLDLEEKKQLKPSIEKLKELGVRFYVFSTGSRGYHIHLFFDRELSKEERLKIIKYFDADTQKASDRTMIALEFACHWKSGKEKELIENGN